MESRLLYIVSEKMKSKINWPNDEHLGWKYYGAGNDVRYDIVMDLINSHFNDDQLYVCWKRQLCYQVEKKIF